MSCAGKAAHVGPNLGQNDFRQASLDARDRFQALEQGFKRVHALGNLIAHAHNRFIQGVDLGEVFTDEEAMMGLEPNTFQIREFYPLMTEGKSLNLSLRSCLV